MLTAFPSPPKNAGYQALKTSARTYLNVLADAAVVAKFVAHELPTDFVQHLTDDLALLEAAEDDQDDGLDPQVTGTATVSRLIGEGNQAVRTLNAVAHHKFTRLPDELRAWLSASHLERSPQRPAATHPPGLPGAAGSPAHTA